MKKRLAGTRKGRRGERRKAVEGTSMGADGRR